MADSKIEGRAGRHPKQVVPRAKGKRHQLTSPISEDLSRMAGPHTTPRIVACLVEENPTMPLKRELIATSALVVALLLTETVSAQSPNADLLVLHGRILTVDEKDSIAQAIAILHGTIVKVGSDAEVLKFAGNGPGIRIIDLHGRTATPGLIDAHAHIADGGVDELYGVKLSDATSVGEILSRVKAKVTQVKSGEWITGSGWDEGKLAEHRYVTAADLDTVAPN